MKKKILVISIAGLLAVPLLTACGDSAAEYINRSADSIYGSITDFSAEPDKVKAGDVLSFKVKPVNSNFSIDQVTNNGVACTYVSTEADGRAIYSTTLSAGKNSILATFNVDKTVDIVDQFKLNLTDEVFAEVMNPSKCEEKVSKKDLDFRRCGIEQVLAPLQFDGSGNKVANTNKNFFINYVDGDTTHMTTKSLNYTVKMRYLGINTPESTSEIEEWGLTASYFNKYIYSGDDTIYETYLKKTTPVKPTHKGVTSAILMSPAFAYDCGKITKEDLKLGSLEPTKYEAEVDGYNRNLIYIWYADVPNPTINDFRCLNLEMAAQGLSISGDFGDMNPDFRLAFSTANLVAEANGLHRFSGLIDPNYDYYDKHIVPTITLEQLYKQGICDDSDIKYRPDNNPLCDKRTLYKIHGFVSRTTKSAFYIQDKPSYSEEYLKTHDPYGLYIFTLRDNALQVGDEVDVVGAISSYGGCYQMQGISYHDINPDPNRDITVYPNRQQIIPIPVTGKELLSKKYPNVLVQVTDPCYGCNWDKINYSVNYGGLHEIDTSNETYTFYNTDNELNVYMGYGDTDRTASLNGGSFNLNSKDLMRVRIDQKVLLKSGTEIGRSTKFFGGGSLLYNINGAEYANYNDDNPFKNDTIEETFTRKKVTKLVGISCAYVSSSGKTKRMQIDVMLADDIAFEPAE